jgi:hypothetical protein
MRDVEIYRKTLNKVLEDLPEEKVFELIRFAISLGEQSKSILRCFDGPAVKAVPVSRLRELAGAVAWGGDALEETERLYE